MNEELKKLLVEENKEEVPVEGDGAEASETQPLEEEAPSPRMFSQDEVDAIVGKTRQEARERALKERREHYGVDSEDELEGLFGRGQSYGMLEEEHNKMLEELGNIKAENALLKSHIRPEKWNDAKFILKGMGLEINEENLAEALSTRPEWSSEAESSAQTPRTEVVNMENPQVKMPRYEEPREVVAPTPAPAPAPAPRPQLEVMGNEGTRAPNMNEDEYIKRMFNL